MVDKVGIKPLKIYSKEERLIVKKFFSQPTDEAKQMLF